MADHHLLMIGRAENPYAPSDAPCRLLLVSDHRASSDALGSHLAHHGFTIVGRESGARAAGEAARRELPDVVLIDAAVREGWQEVVRNLECVPKDHIAVLAAYWSTDARRAAALSGIGATLLKRVEGAELVNRLRALASGHPGADGETAAAPVEPTGAPVSEPGAAPAAG
jgi:DNA-binding response OmpR family regulator